MPTRVGGPQPAYCSGLEGGSASRHSLSKGKQPRIGRGCLSLPLNLSLRQFLCRNTTLSEGVVSANGVEHRSAGRGGGRLEEIPLRIGFGDHSAGVVGIDTIDRG